METVLELRCMRGVRVDYLLLHQPGWTLAAVRRLAARPGPAYMLSGRVCALSASSREDLCRLVREERVWARAVGVCPRCGACSSLETPEERRAAAEGMVEYLMSDMRTRLGAIGRKDLLAGIGSILAALLLDHRCWDRGQTASNTGTRE